MIATRARRGSRHADRGTPASAASTEFFYRAALVTGCPHDPRSRQRSGGPGRHLRRGCGHRQHAAGAPVPRRHYPVRGIRMVGRRQGHLVRQDSLGARAIVAHDLTSGRETVLFEYASQSIQQLMQWPGFRRSPDGTSVAYTGFTFDNNVGGSVVHVRTLGGATVELARARVPDQVEFQDWYARWTSRPPDQAQHERAAEYAGRGAYRWRSSAAAGRTMPAIRDLSMRRDGKTITYTAGMNSAQVPGRRKILDEHWRGRSDGALLCGRHSVSRVGRAGGHTAVLSAQSPKRSCYSPCSSNARCPQFEEPETSGG